MKHPSLRYQLTCLTAMLTCLTAMLGCAACPASAQTVRRRRSQ